MPRRGWGSGTGAEIEDGRETLSAGAPGADADADAAPTPDDPPRLQATLVASPRPRMQSDAQSRGRDR
jgi:hypothetical protein